MNIKVKAATIVAGILAVGLGTVELIKLAFAYFSPETMGRVGTGLIIIGLLYLMYTLVLTRLEIDAKYKGMLDKKNK